MDVSKRECIYGKSVLAIYVLLWFSVSSEVVMLQEQATKMEKERDESLKQLNVVQQKAAAMVSSYAISCFISIPL